MAISAFSLLWSIYCFDNGNEFNRGREVSLERVSDNKQQDAVPVFGAIHFPGR